MTSRWLVALLLVAGLGAEAAADKNVDWGPYLEKPGDKVQVFSGKPDKPAPVVAEAPAKKSAKSAKTAKKQPVRKHA